MTTRQTHLVIIAAVFGGFGMFIQCVCAIIIVQVRYIMYWHRLNSNGEAAPNKKQIKGKPQEKPELVVETLNRNVDPEFHTQNQRNSNHA